jgi:hypothetical protein
MYPEYHRLKKGLANIDCFLGVKQPNLFLGPGLARIVPANIYVIKNLAFPTFQIHLYKNWLSCVRNIADPTPNNVTFRLNLSHLSAFAIYLKFNF